MDAASYSVHKINGCFWDWTPSSKPAFIFPDGSIIDYAQLTRDVDAFAARIADDRGLIGIYCDGDYRQYVAYLGSLRARCPALLLRRGQPRCEIGLTLSYIYFPAEDKLQSVRPDTIPKWHVDLALLLSTSGSTGAKKWVRLSFENIATNALSIATYLGLSDKDRAPMSLPFQYAYGMSIVNSHLAAGASLVLNGDSIVGDGFWKTFEKTGCTSLAGVPHSFELMDQAGICTAHLKKLRYMTQAGGRMAAPRVKAWAERGISEGWHFFAMYGQTEAAPRISYLPPEIILESPGAIGIPVPGGEIQILDDKGASVREGDKGELVYRGPNVMMGYAFCDADLAMARESDLLRTGDMARQLPNGAFEIVGRKNRFVKLFGLRIGLDEVETRLSESGLAVACIAHDDLMHVFVARETNREIDVEHIRREIAHWLKVPPGSFEVETIPELPRRENGKTDYPTLAALALLSRPEKHDGSASFGRTILRQFANALLPRRLSVIDIFRAHFAADQVSMETSFNSAGGDSLGYVSVALELEDLIGSLPEDWPDMTISQLQSLIGRRTVFATIDTPTLIRALAIIAIVGSHTSVFNYGGGGANSLLVVAGMSFFTFTLPQVLNLRRIYPVAVLIIRIATLTLLVTLTNFILTGSGTAIGFLLISNWIMAEAPGSVWFVSVYLQILCGAMLLLTLPGIQRSLKGSRAYWTIAATTAITISLAAISNILVDTNYLYRRLPHLMAWIFMIGMAARAANSFPQRAITTALLIAGIWQFTDYNMADARIAFVAAALLLIWRRALWVPGALLKPLRLIAGSSLIIYLTHFGSVHVAAKVLDALSLEEAIVRPLEWLAAIVGGGVLWRLYDPVDAWLARRIRRLFERDDPIRTSDPRSDGMPSKRLA